MRNLSSLLLAASLLGVAAPTLAQSTNPIVTSWLLNTTSAKGFNNQSANVTSVKYSGTSVYIACPRIPSYSLNYVAPSSGQGTAATNSWFPQPTSGPVAQTCVAYDFRLPLTPTPNTGTPVSIPGASIGVWINGTNIHPAKDAASYNTSTGVVENNGGAVWFTDAVVNEGIGFDVCNGHPDITSVYHTHVNPDCLYDRRDSTRHSPIVGFALDGYPIYGAYGYKNADGTGGIKSMKSSYRLRSITVRHSLSDGVALPASSYGPDVSTTFPLGKFVEDNEYVAGLGDLDSRNGRWCVTPEYPGGTYAYFCTINSFYEGAYPYTIAGTYYGTVPYNNDNASTSAITESVTTYAPPSSLTVSTSKLLAGGSFTNVTVTSTGNLMLVQPLTVSGALTVQTGGALDVASLDPNTQVVSGTGTASVATGARLTVANTAGITSSGSTGAIQVSGTRTFNSDAEYVYAGSAAQTTGTGLPATVKTLTVNNSAGLTLSQSTALSGTLTLQSGALATASGKNLTINSGGTLTAGTQTINGGGNFTLASGATLKTGNTSGVRAQMGGTIGVMGTATLSSGATYEFNGTAAQSAGAGLPSTVGTLVVNNSAGVTLVNSLAVSSALTLTSGTLSVPTTKTLTVSSGATLNAGTQIIDGAGGFTLASGGTLKTGNTAGITSGSTATGSVQVTGTRSFNTGASYEYNGTAAQITGTGLPATVAGLTINNAAGVTLSSNVSPSTAFTMSSGTLTTGSNKVTPGTTATITESSTSYLTGSLETTRTLNTAGSTVDFGGIGLKLTATGSTLPGSVTVSRVTGTAPSSVNGGSGISRYFNITATNNSSLNVTMQFNYLDSELNGLSEASLGVYRSTVSPTAGPWVLQTGTLTRDATNNVVTLSGITGFSSWTLGNDGSSLPVELTAFSATTEGRAARLRWTTASEKNNDHFDVERSLDGQEFTRIGQVAGQGSKGSATEYSFLDDKLTTSPAHHLTYYRLRQVDTDGTTSYSPVRAINFTQSLIHSFTIAPNPSSGTEPLSLALTASTAGEATLTLRDALGRVQYAGRLDVPMGSSLLELPAALAARLPAGVYALQLQLNGQQTVVRLVRQ